MHYVLVVMVTLTSPIYSIRTLVAYMYPKSCNHIKIPWGVRGGRNETTILALWRPAYMLTLHQHYTNSVLLGNSVEGQCSVKAVKTV